MWHKAHLGNSGQIYFNLSSALQDRAAQNDDQFSRKFRWQTFRLPSIPTPGTIQSQPLNVHTLNGCLIVRRLDDG